ncbi:MAG: prepilin-type N-terminal cleavage/methylation domain-containing protein [Pseudomonadales bacterium]
MYLRHSQRRCDGFTLLELLVVLMLVGFIAGAAALRPIQTDSRTLSSSASELRKLLIAMATEAVLENQQLGLLIDETTAIAVTQGKGGTWLVKESQQYALEMPDMVRMSMIYNKSQDRASLSRGGSKELVPDIVFLESGELSAFSLSISNTGLPNERFELHSDGLNVELRQL